MDIGKGFNILLAVFGLLTLVTNLDTRMPRFPWDVIIDKFGFRVYLPVITSIFLAIVFTILLNQFQ